jgi:hypothetical protein
MLVIPGRGPLGAHSGMIAIGCRCVLTNTRGGGRKVGCGFVVLPDGLRLVPIVLGVTMTRLITYLQ